jgi:hypothetical protein
MTTEIKCFQAYNNVDYGQDNEHPPIWSDLITQKFQLIVYAYNEGYKKIAFICESEKKAQCVKQARKNGFIISPVDIKNVTVIKGDRRSTR